MTDSPATRIEQGAPATTTDVLKLVGVVALFVDHYGLFYADDVVWWRILGRPAAPIFFFLIGFARTRSVPWSWLAFGIALTGLDYLTSEGVRDTHVNILIHFAVLRFTMPLWEGFVLRSRVRILALAALSAVLIPATDTVIEYGSEGWLWTLFGLLHRRVLDGAERERASLAATRNVVAALTGAAYAAREIADYELGAAQAVALATLIGLLVIVLLRFRRADLPLRLAPGLEPAVKLAGRYSLEIYAGSLLVLELLFLVREHGLG